MVQKIRQYRYYDDNNIKNHSGSPEKLTKEKLVSGDFLNCTSVVKLGIQTIPGTKFYLNSSVNPVIVGITGIYELDLNQVEINSIKFAQDSMDFIESNHDAYLFVDILYREA